MSPEFTRGRDRVEYDPDPVVVAVQRQAEAASRVVDAVTREADPQAWLFAERARYVREGVKTGEHALDQQGEDKALSFAY